MSWKSIIITSLCLVATFVFGGVCGVFVATRPYFVKSAQSRWDERWIESRFNEDAKRMKFTAEQKQRVHPLYDQMLVDIRKVREQTTASLVEAGRDQAKKLWTELTPEQQQEFVKLGEERLVQLNKFKKP